MQKRKSMAKSAKIEDVTKPEKVAPSATARPIIVTNRPVLASDPMMVAASDAQPKEKSDTPEATISRSAKTIAPISKDIVVDHAEAEETKDTAPEQDDPSATPAKEPEEAATPETPAKSEEPVEPKPEEPTPAESEPESDPESEPEPTEPARDVEAEQTAKEAKESEATAERMQELESLIEKGTYTVPINAVRRKRSRIFATIFIITTLVVAVIALDVLLDANIVKLPWNIPHTNFL